MLAGQPNFRAARLYDPSDADAPLINAVLRRWTGLFKRFRAPRPSGAPGLLVAKMIHLRRPSARALEAAVHVSADPSTPERALVALINPTRRTLSAKLAVPLWYTGLPPGSTLHLAPLNLSHVAAHGAPPTAARAADGGHAATGAPADARIAAGVAAPSAAEPQPFVSGRAFEVHTLGADAGAGFTDVVLDVQLGPASYAVLLATVA